nr:MAG TPA: hypothetical protein [Caudoviricetes sp.]
MITIIILQLSPPLLFRYLSPPPSGHCLLSKPVPFHSLRVRLVCMRLHESIHPSARYNRISCMVGALLSFISPFGDDSFTYT